METIGRVSGLLYATAFFRDAGRFSCQWFFLASLDSERGNFKLFGLIY